MAHGHLLHGPKKEREKIKPTNFAGPTFNSESARDPRETAGGAEGVFAFQRIIKTERKIYRAGVRFRGRRTPWCRITRVSTWASFRAAAGAGGAPGAGGAAPATASIPVGAGEASSPPALPLRDLELAEALAEGPASNSQGREGFPVLGRVLKFSQGLAWV